MKIYKYNTNKILICIAVLFLNSCEKVFMKPDASTEPEAVFKEIWTFTDRHYSFFEYKGIDWNELYDRYSPLVSNDMGTVEFFDLCAAMLYELKDGHVNLLSSFDRSRNWEWFLDSPENFYYSIIERHYFKGNERYIGPFQYLNMDDIAYVYYGSFGNIISEDDLNVVISSLEDKQALILDVRNNGGGSTENAKNIARRFTEEKTLVGINWIKTGSGHEDFRQEEIYIEPFNGERFTGEVIVLTNRKSYSATTYFTQYMRELENVTVVGDTTGGGGGIPAFRDLSNGWLLRVSSSRFYSPEGLNIENGIPPDYQVYISPDEAFKTEKDAIIEKAIQLIRDKK